MGRTFFIDIDGTIVKHLDNNEIDYIIENNCTLRELLLPGVKDLWESFHEDDYIIITTARTEKHRKFTEKLFDENNLYYDLLIMDLPSGPRIIINDVNDVDDNKAIGINVLRNTGFCKNKFLEELNNIRFEKLK
jgi:hypothetical protein